MKRLGPALVAGLAWGGLAQAAPIKVEPVETLGSPVAYQDGMAGARSSLARSEAAIIIVRGTLDEKDRLEIGLAVRNHGQAAFNLTPQAVEVRTADGRPMPVFTSDEIQAAVLESARKRERWARIAEGLDGMGAAMRDRPTKADPSYAHDAARARAEGQAAVEAAGEAGFRAQTVEPGDTYSTELGLGALPKGAEALTISVTLAGETHVFPVKVSRYR